MKMVFHVLFLLGSVSLAAANFLTPQSPDDAKVSLLRREHKNYFAQFAKAPEVQRDWISLRGQNDLSTPAEVFISPEKEFPGVEISVSPDFSDARRFAVDSKGRVRPGALRMDTKYYWRGVASDGQTGKTHTFITGPGAPRWIFAPGLSNVRDVGNWKSARFGGTVRQGLLYRGSEFDDHMKITDEAKDILLNDLKIKTDLDLRGARFSEEKGYHPVFEGKLQRFLFPIDSYAKMIDPVTKGEVFRNIFSVLADEKNYPVYVHCWGGADRTGTVIFLTECILGLADEDLFRDYESTSFGAFGERNWRTKDSKDSDFYGMLKKLDAYGKPGDPYSVKGENFLRACGVTDEVMRKIRTILLAQ
ncbi:MAG: tyrosine-protein phosphatase [Victivallaceae bacterium]|nr:tyrosine-protein phosphatase [Victivallaceae bacterium]